MLATRARMAAAGSGGAILRTLPSFVAKASGDGTTTSLAIGVPTGTATGDVMVAIITTYGQTATATGWTVHETMTSDPNGSAVSTVTTVLHKVAEATPAGGTFTIGASRAMAGTICTYRDVDTTTPFHAYAETKGSGGTVTAPTLTTTVGNCKVVAVAGADGNSTFTESGITMRDEVSAGTVAHGVYDFDHATAGATGNKSITSSAGGVWLGIQAALLGAPE